MSFALPGVLLALLALPAGALELRAIRRRQAAREEPFAAAAVLPSVAPRSPGPRRTVPLAALLGGLVLLILAAARPQHTVSAALRTGAVMLADDVSSSMAATDLRPSRLAAAGHAAEQFIAGLPPTIKVGVLAFNQAPLVLQSPTTDHTQARVAVTELRVGGRTAIGDAILTALTALRAAGAGAGAPQGAAGPSGPASPALPPSQSPRIPGAIVLLSDGTSTTGTDPVAAAQRAAAAHVPIYTVSIGTPAGTITVPRGGHPVTVPVPVDGSELAAVARASGGRDFTAADTTRLQALYTRLAAGLSHHSVERSLLPWFAGGGLALLALGAGLSLLWFGRPI
jgi:Ca-activated chloride channel family protein